MTKEDIACIIQWFAHIEQLATDRKNANGIVMEDVGHLLNTIKVIAKDSREYVERFCQPSLPSNLFEAKVAFSEERFPDEKMAPLRRAARIGYEAGAEWMAGQGVSMEYEVEDKCLELGYGSLPGLDPIINLPDSFKPGDKVIIQIRKKK